MTELPTRRQVFDAIRAESARTSTTADHNGRTDEDRARDAAAVAAMTQDAEPASAVAETAPAPTMAPNPAQGEHATVPTQPQGSVLDRIKYAQQLHQD